MLFRKHLSGERSSKPEVAHDAPRPVLTAGRYRRGTVIRDGCHHDGEYQQTENEPMTAPNEETTDESTSERPSCGRRPLLKALGVGTGLATLGGGGVAAQETTTQTDETTEFDPVFGLPLAVDATVPDSIDPAHVVELDVAEEENIHEGFPLRPDPQNPDQMIEAEEEFLFDPVGLRLAPGDVVHFKSIAHLHTVTAFAQKWDESEEFLQIPTRIPEGVPGFHSPLLPEEASWLYEFTETGVYDIFCLPHVSFGMVQRIVVVDSETDAEAPAAPSGKTFPNAMAVLSAPELQPEHIVENETVAWSDLTLEMEAPTETTTTA